MYVVPQENEHTDSKSYQNPDNNEYEFTFHYRSSHACKALQIQNPATTPITKETVNMSSVSITIVLVKLLEGFGLHSGEFTRTSVIQANKDVGQHVVTHVRCAP